MSGTPLNRRWLRGDAVELWTPEAGKPFPKAKRKRRPKLRTDPGSGRGRRRLKMRVGE